MAALPVLMEPDHMAEFPERRIDDREAWTEPLRSAEITDQRQRPRACVGERSQQVITRAHIHAPHLLLYQSTKWVPVGTAWQRFSSPARRRRALGRGTASPRCGGPRSCAHSATMSTSDRRTRTLMPTCSSHCTPGAARLRCADFGAAT